MKCPGCGEELSRTDFLGVPVERCAPCDSLWLDETEPEALAERVAVLQRHWRYVLTPADLGGPRRAPPVPPGERDCQRCGGRLAVVQVRGIAMEACTACRGVWAEREALNSLMGRVVPTTGFRLHGPYVRTYLAVVLGLTLLFVAAGIRSQGEMGGWAFGLMGGMGVAMFGALVLVVACYSRSYREDLLAKMPEARRQAALEQERSAPGGGWMTLLWFVLAGIPLAGGFIYYTTGNLFGAVFAGIFGGSFAGFFAGILYWLVVAARQPQRRE